MRIMQNGLMEVWKEIFDGTKAVMKPFLYVLGTIFLGFAFGYIACHILSKWYE